MYLILQTKPLMLADCSENICETNNLLTEEILKEEQDLETVTDNKAELKDVDKQVSSLK